MKRLNTELEQSTEEFDYVYGFSIAEMVDKIHKEVLDAVNQTVLNVCSRLYTSKIHMMREKVHTNLRDSRRKPNFNSLLDNLCSDIFRSVTKTGDDNEHDDINSVSSSDSSEEFIDVPEKASFIKVGSSSNQPSAMSTPHPPSVSVPISDQLKEARRVLFKNRNLINELYDRQNHLEDIKSYLDSEIRTFRKKNSSEDIL
ncbi:hypothetical protein GJ496_012003 [Pomphorhynchus laevis]|nr:hypothetical protein GJ496_012003 [Pomphorhynchus laevis]